MSERITENICDKMRMADSMSENMGKSVTWWGSLEESNLFRRLSKQNDALWGPARIIAIINNGNDIKHLILDSFFFALWLW